MGEEKNNAKDQHVWQRPNVLGWVERQSKARRPGKRKRGDKKNHLGKNVMALGSSAWQAGGGNLEKSGVLGCVCPGGHRNQGNPGQRGQGKARRREEKRPLNDLKIGDQDTGGGYDNANRAAQDTQPGQRKPLDLEPKKLSKANH